MALAIEHGNPEYRSKYLYRKMSNETLLEAIKILESAGIRVATPIMVGLPLTKLKDDLDTLKFAIKASPTYASATIFQPYPGLPLTQVCLKNNLIDKDYQKQLGNDCYARAPLHDIDYPAVEKLRNNFVLLRRMHEMTGIKVEKLFKYLPNNLLSRFINNIISFILFNKIYDYNRGVIGRFNEIFIGIMTGAYGIKIKKNMSKW